MYQEERLKLITDYVNKNKQVSTHELSEKFKTSLVTIRSDLNIKRKKGLLIKTHGGAVTNSYRINDVIPSNIKFKKNVAEKKKIAKLASRYINDGDVIILDSGSTTLELAKILQAKNITVFTNDLQIGLVLSKNPNVKLNMSGGELIEGVYTLAGYETENYFNSINVDKLFLSCDALDVNFGISNRDRKEIGFKQAMIRNSKEITLLIDHTKLNSKVLLHVADINELDRIIVDKISNKDLKEYQKYNIEIVTD